MDSDYFLSVWHTIGRIPFFIAPHRNQRTAAPGIVFSGIGIILIGGIFLYVNREKVHPTLACFVGIASAYLANAFLCLFIYGENKFEGQARSGWYLTLVVVLPILIEWVWLLFKKSGAQKK